MYALTQSIKDDILNDRPISSTNSQRQSMECLYKEMYKTEGGSSWWRNQMDTFSAWPVNFPPKGQRCGALMFSFICALINGWVKNREAGDLRCHRAHYDISLYSCPFHCTPILMTCNSGMKHNVWVVVPCRLFLTKVVSCYIPCLIDFYGCIDYDSDRNDLFVEFVLICVGDKCIVFVHCQNDIKFEFGGVARQTTGAHVKVHCWYFCCKMGL